MGFFTILSNWSLELDKAKSFPLCYLQCALTTLPNLYGIRGVYLVLYADYILLLLSFRMLYNCERELDALDLAINIKKSHAVCELDNRLTSNVSARISLLVHFYHGYQKLNRVYLGVHILESKNFKVSTIQPRRSFYHTENAIFGRVGRAASEEVVLHLMIKSVYQFCYMVLKLAL